MNSRINEEYSKVSYLDLSHDPLISSVVGPPATINTLITGLKYNQQINSVTAAPPNGLIRCLSLSSLLDPNVDLPNISARDVDDVLSVSNNWKMKRESSLPSVSHLNDLEGQNVTLSHEEYLTSSHLDTNERSINVEDDTILVDDDDKGQELDPLACRVDSFSDLFTATNESLHIINDTLDKTSSDLHQLIEKDVEVVDDEDEEIIIEKEADHLTYQTDSFSTVFVGKDVALYESDTKVIDNSESNFPSLIDIYKTPIKNKIEEYNQTALLPITNVNIDDEEVNVVQVDDEDDEAIAPLNVTINDNQGNGGGSECNYSFQNDGAINPKRCTSAPIPFWQDGELIMDSLEEMTDLGSTDTPAAPLNNDSVVDSNPVPHPPTISPTKSVTKPTFTKLQQAPSVMIIRESDICKSKELKQLFTKLKPFSQIEYCRANQSHLNSTDNDMEAKRKMAQSMLPSCATSGVVNFNSKLSNHALPTNQLNLSSLLVNSRKRKLSSPPGLNSNFSNTLSTNDRFKYICPHHNCGKRFIVEDRLIHHRTNYHNEMLFSCTEINCEQKFSNDKERRIHLEHFHSDKYSHYRCEECNTNFSRLALLRKHKEHGHPNQLFTCNYCGKIFLNQCRFEKHQSRHSNENIHKCPHNQCNKSFLFEVHLNKHLRNVHSIPPPVQSLGNHNTSSVKLQTNNEELIQRLDASVNTAADSGGNVEMRSVEVMHVPNTDADKDLHSPTIRVIYSCPIKDCNLAFDHQSEFHEHFVKHFTGEVPGDLNSLLPEDLPSTEEGMELPSMTFDANVGGMQGNQLMQEGSSLLDALDLILAETLDMSNKPDSLNQQLLVPDLTSALTLPALQPAGMHRNKQMHSGVVVNAAQTANQNQYNNGGRSSTSQLTNQNHTQTQVRGGNDQTRHNFQLTGCARTCPVTNNVMSSLVKRRRALLRERITLGYEPLPLMDNQLALKDVMRQIFHSKELPVKYKDTRSELNQSFKKQ